MTCRQELCFIDSWARTHTNRHRANTEAVSKSLSFGRWREGWGVGRRSRDTEMLKTCLLQKCV